MRAPVARLAGAVCALSLGATITDPALHLAPTSATGSRHALVAIDRPGPVPTGAVRVGPLRASTTLSLRVVLEPRSPSVLASFIDGVSSPSSPDYRQFLGRGQFATRFGPTGAAIAAVRTTLTSAGLDVTGLSPSHLVLSVTGTERAVATALHTGFSQWRLDSGRLAFRTDGPVELPAALATDVAAVAGTSALIDEHSFAVRGHRRAVDHRAVPAAVGSRQPPSECDQAKQELPSGTFTPEEEGAAYGMSSLWAHDDDGSGHTVALLEFAPYSLSDIVYYDSCFGALPNGATSDPLLHNVYVDGGTSPGSAGGSDEPTLDIEEIRAIAPLAQLNVYEGPNNVLGPIDTLQRIATDDTAQVVSISWGICEQFSDHAAETPVFEQMAAQGQTVFAAAGDNGSSDCLAQSPAGGPPIASATVDDPASQPLVTGVGGMTVTSVQPLVQTVWNDCTSSLPGCLSDASGGGISQAYAHPAWQVAPGVPTGGQRGATRRDVPDLSVMGDPNTGMLAYYESTFQPYGGTSMGPPLMAAMVADDLQACGTTTIGFLNPLFYAMARQGGDFDDVTTGTNAVATTTYKANEFNAGPGYDMASGLGSPDPTTFLTALCNAVATATATPATPNVSSTWLVTYHTGGVAYPSGTTVTLVAPPSTRLPSSTTNWTVATSDGTDAPSAVALRASPGSTSDNVATLTVTQGAPSVGAITIQATEVVNPLTVGTASVTVTDSAATLSERAVLSLSAPSPQSASFTVLGEHAPYAAALGSDGAELTATVSDGAGDVVAGLPLTISTTGHGVARTTTTSTNDAGQLRLDVRDDRAESTTVSVTSGVQVLGSVQVGFTNPWRTETSKVLAGSGVVAGIPSIASTGATGFVGVVRTTTGGLDLARPGGARLVVSPLLVASTAPAVASNPSLTRGGAWLYLAYRSTTGHLVVLSAPGKDPGGHWRVDDLTARGVVPTVLGAPSAITAGAGARAVLSIAAIVRGGHVLRVTAPLSHTTRAAVANLSDLAAWSAPATGALAQLVMGGAVVVFAHATDGELVELARDPQQWLADDLANDALLVGPSSIATGSPVAAVADGQATVIAPSRGGLDLFVGSLGNWSSSLLVAGDEGTSAPSDARALPSLQGAATVEIEGPVTDVVCASGGGRLIELTSLGVSAPWAAFDLTSLAHLAGPVAGAAALPTSAGGLLVTLHGHLVELRNAS